MSRLPTPGPLLAFAPKYAPGGTLTFELPPPDPPVATAFFYCLDDIHWSAAVPSLGPPLAATVPARPGQRVGAYAVSSAAGSVRAGPVRWFLVPTPEPAPKPPRPAPPAITFGRIQEPTVSQFIVDITPSPGGPEIQKTTITPIVNGTAQTPVATTGAPIAITVDAGATVSATETVTNTAGFTSDPSDEAAPLTVTDPRPSKPGPPTLTLLGPAPGPPP